MVDLLVGVGDPNWTPGDARSVVDRAERDGNQGRFGRPNGDSENWTGVVPWGHTRAAAAAVARTGPGAPRWGVGPNPGRRDLVRARHVSDPWATLGRNARSAARPDVPVT